MSKMLSKIGYKILLTLVLAEIYAVRATTFRPAPASSLLNTLSTAEVKPISQFPSIISLRATSFGQDSQELFIPLHR